MIISINKPPAETGDFPKIKKMQCSLSITFTQHCAENPNQCNTARKKELLNS